MNNVTMQDVARLAGVSRSAVSNYYNRPDLVSEGAAHKIQSAIESLGFVPHAMAQSLRAGRTKTIGVLLPDAFIPIFGDMARGIESAAHEQGWRVYVASSDFRRDRERDYITQFISSHVDGLVVYPIGDVRRDLETVERRGIRTVVMGEHSSDGMPREYPTVSIDDRLGGRLVGEHLIATGRQHITFIGDVLRHDIGERYRGLLDALVGHPDVEVSMMPAADITIGAGVRAASELLAGRPRCDAIFASTDMLALGVLQALQQHDRRIPEDIALVGYDDIEFASQLIVPLTTVRVPAREMGAASIELLAAAQSGQPPRHIVVRPSLVVRVSA